MKLALFDIGSNSIRYMNGTYQNGQWHNEPKRLWTTRLGQRDEEGQLTKEAMDATCRAIEEGLQLAKAYGADRIEALATSAVREAPNGKAFAKYIEETYKITVHIISGTMEATIGFMGAAGDFLKNGERCAVIDLGGASTEVAVGSLTEIAYSRSYPVGAVRCRSLSEEGIQRIWEETHGLWDPIAMTSDFKGFIGIGGTFTTLAAMDLKLMTYAPEKVHGHTITREFIESEALFMRYMSSEERANIPGLSAARQDIIVSGMEIVSSIMDTYDIGSIVVSEKDGMEGWQQWILQEANHGTC